MPPHLEQSNQPNPSPSTDLTDLFHLVWGYYQKGENTIQTIGEWYGAVQDGVITLRKKSLVKWPEHDKSPEKKRLERDGDNP